ncbi:N-acetyltransferase [Rhodococcus rhodochrous]|nr:N-acetyltransferase [Rhodococcus rhodochrous]
MNADPEVRSGVGGWEFPKSIHEQKRWFESGSSGGTTQRWIVESADGVPIGLVGLWNINWHDRNAEVGIKIASGVYRGKGYGTDILLSTCTYAFHEVGLNRLYASIRADNRASLKIFTTHAGWSVEGRWRHHVWRQGAYVDVVHVGVLASEFINHPYWKDYCKLISEGRVDADGEGSDVR